MRTIPATVAGLFLLICLALSGCGGGGGSTTAESAFQGLYQGPWVQTSFANETLEEGTATLSIASTGNVTGTFSVTGSPTRSGSLAGKVLPSGSVGFTVTYDDGTEQFHGTLTLDGEELTGPFGQPGVLYPGNMPRFDLTRFTL